MFAWSSYVGIPFRDCGRSVDGCDCWGLVRLVYAEALGILLPSYVQEYDSSDGGQAACAIAAHRHEWVAADVPQPFDVALLRQDGKAQHVGIIIDDQLMLHTTRATGGVIERYRERRWRANFLGAYRLP